MRPIKLRAWDKEDKQMWVWHENLCMIEHSGRVFDLSDAMQMKDRFEFMQFTGLLDKNGKEIYEGDVLEDKSEDNGADFGAILRRGKYEVVWSKEYCCFSLDNYFWHISETQAKRLEVIGNIYENPDLIK